MDEITTKRRLKKDTLLNVYKVLYLALIAACFAAAWYLSYKNLISYPFFRKGNIYVVIIYALVSLGIVRVYGGFMVSLSTPSELVFSQFFALLLTNVLAYMATCFLSRKLVDILPLIAAFIVQMVLSSVWSKLAVPIYYKLTPVKKTLVVYGDKSALNTVCGVYKLEAKFKVLDTISVEMGLDEVLKRLKGMDAVFICGVKSSFRNDIVKQCIYKNIQAYVRPRIGDLLISNSRKIHMFNVPILLCTRAQPKQFYLIVKRVIDVVASLVAVVILSPLMLITAIIIKCYDKGPILYKQCRLTKDGEKFNVLKFRSMRIDAEKDGVARLSTGDKDDRITPVGKVIRAIRFDELPQLFNILGGSMTIVGPRPERPEIAAQYEGIMPEFAMRLQVKAGLTGYAQIYGKYNTTPYDKLQMDLIYIANQSIVEDLKIMLMTVKILFKKDSTEGVAVGATTAAEI
jgi:lipopolysaccharide/colanic/teichoic acid biosynthesis glycosyltransferase